MRLALRVLGAVLVVITLLFPWPATASAFGPPTGRTHQFCTYDAPIYDAPASYSAIERGPPVAAYVPDFAQSANDLRSNGASARPGGSTTRDSYDYDTTATPLQVDNSAGATNGLAEGASRAIASPQRWRVAAKSADEGVDLFRHVSPGELTDIGENGFRAGPGSLDGKWFAESGAHASEWGRVLNGGEGSVVRVRVPNTFADQLMRLEKLDGIGPARYVEPHQLAELNRYPRGLR